MFILLFRHGAFPDYTSGTQPNKIEAKAKTCHNFEILIQNPNRSFI